MLCLHCLCLESYLRLELLSYFYPFNIIAFIIFVGVKMATGGGKKDAKPQQVASVEISTLALENDDAEEIEDWTE